MKSKLAILYSNSFSLGKERYAETGPAVGGCASHQLWDLQQGFGLFFIHMENGGYLQLPKPSSRIDERLKLYRNPLKMEKANSKHNILLVLLKRNIYPTCLKLLCFFPSSANTVLTLKHPRLSSESSIVKSYAILYLAKKERHGSCSTNNSQR